jgi:hypothetical protein
MEDRPKMIARREMVLWTALLILLAGCGRSGRHGLEGTVTLDGQPLPLGAIRFVPQPGTGGPSAGGEIRDGAFAIDSDKGVFGGSFRVEITASRKTGNKVRDRATGEAADIHAQFLPARYNSSSELTAEVQEDGPNRFEFALHSK